MNVVAFDCSFDYVQVVLYQADKVKGGFSFNGSGRSASGRKWLERMVEDKQLVGAIWQGDFCSTEKTLKLFADLLAQKKLLPSDLDALVVISGPGSFTSLRVSAMVVKVLGYTENIPLYAFSHFDLERHFCRTFFDDLATKWFLMVHAIHKREFAYVLLEKNQLYADTPLHPKVEKVNDLDRWFDECQVPCDDQLLVVLGQGAHWFFNLLRDFFIKRDDFERRGYFFSESEGDLCIKKDGVLRVGLLEKKVELFPNDLDKKKFSLGLLIHLVLQGSSGGNIDLDFHRVDAKDFCPDYMGGSWS